MNVTVDISEAPAAPVYGIVPGLICAYRLHPSGSCEALPVDQAIPFRNDGWLWLHVNLVDTRAAAWIRTIGLPGPALAIFTSNDVHQQLHATDSCIYGVMSGLVRNFDGQGDEFAHLHFAMTERLLISGRHRALCGIDAVRQAFDRGSHKLPSVAGLLELIVEHVSDGVDRLADRLSRDLDKIEDDLSRGAPGDHHQELGRSRRTSVRLHRQLAGLRSLFYRIENDGDGMAPALRFGANKIAQRLDALDHDIVEIRDRSRLLQEEIAVATAEQSNRALRVLTIITTVILPPTLVAGAFGMNLKGMPFSENADGFWWAAAVMLLSAVTVYGFIRRTGIGRTSASSSSRNA